MKGNNIRRGSLLSSAACLTLAVLMAILGGCSKQSSGDARDLLATVPADAGTVMVVNVHSMLEKTGFKFKDGKPVPSAQTSQWIDSIADPKAREIFKALAEGEMGLAYNAGVVFLADQLYVSVLLDNPDLMRQRLNSAEHINLTETSGVWHDGRFAIKGNQMWWAAQYDVRPETINSFADLSEKKSFLSNRQADELASLKNDLYGVGDLTSLTRMAVTRGLMDPQTAGMTSMALSMIFDTPAYLTLTGNYTPDKEVSFSVGVLDKEFKAAEYLLPAGKVDPGAIKETAPKAYGYGAVCVSSKLIDKVMKMASSFGGALPQDFTDMLKPIDGTIAFAMGSDMMGFTVLVQTTGDGTSALHNLLSSFGSVTREGKNLRLTSGTIEGGDLEGAKSAELLKGAVAGMVYSDEPGGAPVVFALRPAGKSLEAELHLPMSNISATIPGVR